MEKWSVCSLFSGQDRQLDMMQNCQSILFKTCLLLPLLSITNVYAIVAGEEEERRIRRRVKLREEEKFETENEVLIWVVIVSVERSVMNREMRVTGKKESMKCWTEGVGRRRWWLRRGIKILSSWSQFEFEFQCESRTLLFLIFSSFKIERVHKLIIVFCFESCCKMELL